ncbi:GGDEF domain-containing protein [Aureimonas flava]|uniref:diguanylate cyclase n=1 Tax=Aureimonas flava TaxID=2320271 RepID=A0A3A1WPM2_9HYPH|nr:GGDEF domain-containing protein [Aureimonas flava]RIY02693.1 GGDEF domain-containing protein [Aureimonas flava]
MNAPQFPAIEAEFQRINRLRFSPSIEAVFNDDGLAHRKRVGRVTLVIGILIYDAFLFADWQTLPHLVGTLALARLCVFTPLCLAIMWLLPRTTTVRQIDAMTVFGTFAAVLLPTVIMTLSPTPQVLIYQFGSMITITYFSLVQRVRFWFAAWGLTLLVVAQIWCVSLVPSIDATSFLFVINFYVAGAVLLMTGSYILERTERHGFLERLRAEYLVEHIERTARTDLLTGLSNRHHLAAVASEIARTATRGDAPIAALMIDIDHFKKLNDTQGHIAGDHCIRSVADVVRETLEGAAGDVSGRYHAFRFGGEEFLVLLPDTTLAEAAVHGDAIRRRLQAARIPHPAMGEEAVVTVSVGVAACRMADFSLDALVGAADAALYRAKRDGRDRLAMAA